MCRLMILTCCLSFLCGLCASVQADAVENYLKAQMEQYHIPGLSVAIVRNGKIIKLKSFGKANLEWNAPATPDTLYQLASATKPLVGTALMLLVEEGKIGLDDAVSKVLPDAPAAWHGITLRHLANHSSGIQNFDAATRWDSVEQAVKASEALPLAYPPGEQAAYGSSDAIVLMHILEKVTGKSLPAFLHERLFLPLGMTATRFSNAVQDGPIRFADVLPNRAGVYDWQENRQVVADFLYPIWTYAAGGLYASASDLAKWSVALDKGILLKATSLEQMWTRGKLNDGTESNFGLCWIVESYKGRKVVGHSGGPALADILRFPEEKLTVIVLTNQRRLSPTLAQGVADILLAASTQSNLPQKTK